MEIAHGDYGDVLEEMAAAVREGRCDSGESAAGVKASDAAETTRLLHQMEDGVGVGVAAPPPPSTDPASTSLLDSDDNLSGCNSFPTSCWTQFLMLLQRSFICILRDQVSRLFSFFSPYQA